MKLMLLCLLLCGCATAPVLTNGIPHLLPVDRQSHIWRSGQPLDTAEAWGTLDALQITNVVKLNLGTEGHWPGLLGIRVQSFPLDIFHQFVEPDNVEMHAAVDAVGPNSIVHCKNGNDRTGMIVGLYRLRTGWSKADAEKEMIDNGFHKSEAGLWRYWQRQKAEDWR